MNQVQLQNIKDAIVHALIEFPKEIDANTLGLAESIAIRDEGSDTTFPAIVLPNGECINVYGAADKHDVTIYHRLNGINFQENAGASFGSGAAYDEVSDMSIIAFGKRLSISQFRLEELLRKAIVSQSGTLVSSDFNSLQVFANEYVGASFALPPEYFMFKINYRLTSTWMPGCKKSE